MGPAARLVAGTTVEVVRFNGLSRPIERVPVVLGDVVADRVVHHREGGPAWYVVVTFSGAAKGVV